LYLALGLFFAGGFNLAIQLFPKPVLGVILLFEALTLMKLVGDMFQDAADTTVLLLVGLAAFGLPYGYVIGLVVGAALAYFFRMRRTSAAV
jgi:adenine/guanine phosphoribosyltransferase-like PRPP-binding protein